MHENDLSAQTTRDQLNGCFCEMAKNFGLFTEVQQARTLEVQARFIALGNNTQGITAAALASDESWIKIANERQVSNEAVNAARTLVNSGNGVPKGVPSVGEIGFALGYATKEDKNALLAAQAAERTIRATERALNHKAEPTSEEAFVAIVKSPKWRHIGSPSDPAYLQAAQLANFKAEILEAAVALAPEMLQNGEVNLAINQALQSLQGIATISYMNGANVLGTHHPAAAERIKNAANDVAISKELDEPFDFVKTTAHMRIADQGLTTALNYLAQQNKLSPEAQQALTSPVQTQPQQAGGMVR